MNKINLQPTLKSHLIEAVPLQPHHFNVLFTAASDPLIWEQHPNKNRWQLKEFANYFEGAIKSGGAFLVSNAQTGEVLGSSRYVVDETDNSISIGYTFFVRSCWGKGYNPELKKLMLNHIFQYVDTIYFFIGAVNKRSQIAIERIGAKKVAEKETAYYGEPVKLDYVYAIEKINWQ